MESQRDGKAPDRILIVEDERIVAHDLADTLRDLGYSIVDVVGTGEDAIAKAETLPVSAILMDVRLAGEIDGVETAERIRATQEVPIVYLTAHADDETLRRAKGTQPFGYLVKPYRIPDLKCALELAIHKHEINQRLARREQWADATLQAMASEQPKGYGNPVAVALSGWKHDEEIGQELERLVVERTSQLVAANRELEAFSYSVAHDLRAPLRGIDGFSQALIEEHAANLGPEGLDYLARVRGATKRMSVLIDDLLRLARTATAALERHTVDVSTLARATADALEAADRSRQVAFTIESDIVVDGDPGLIRIVLDNLLGNAWKFTRKAAAPYIEVGRRNGGFFVRDNGSGFDASAAPPPFRAFQRFHASGEYEGNGIGLAIAHRIVVRHGGQLWADSAVGRGAMFSVVL